jgi:hypothetical protein
MAIRNQIGAALAGLNAQIYSAYGDMIYITEEDHFEYPTGGTITDMPDITELDRPEPKKGQTSGHMIDLRRKGDAIGGGETFFRDARQATINAAVADMSTRARQTFEKEVLTRALTDNENVLGTAGYDVGFCDASATVTYAPPSWGGQNFATTHTHYIGVDSGSFGYGNMLDQLALTVQQHGHPPPFIAYVSETDVSNYTALTKFVEPINDRIVVVDRAGATSGAQFMSRGDVSQRAIMGGWEFGGYQSDYGYIALRSTPRIPQFYAFLYKSYGTNNPRNAIGIRVHPSVGFGIYIEEVPNASMEYPVKHINVTFEYGVSCGNDRSVGAAGYLVAGGVWVDPTIS